MHIVYIYTYLYVSVLQFYLDDIDKKRVYIYMYILSTSLHFHVTVKISRCYVNTKRGDLKGDTARELKDISLGPAGFFRFSPQKNDGKLGEMKGKPMEFLGANTIP